VGAFSSAGDLRTCQKHQNVPSHTTTKEKIIVIQPPVVIAEASSARAREWSDPPPTARAASATGDSGRVQFDEPAPERVAAPTGAHEGAPCALSEQRTHRL
jgi:hypothetical protein